MGIKELSEKIGDLKKMPLFYLFLSSQELFHTNFWCWLFKIDKRKAITMFTDIKDREMEGVNFEREKRFKSKDKKANTDLAIMNGKKPICIIENKVKDFPTEEQLDRIEKAVNKKCEYILVTLIKLDENKVNGWKQRSYFELAEKIEKLNFRSDNIFDEMLIKEYIKFIKKLSEIMKELPMSKNYDFVKSYNKELYEVLEEAKLDVLYSKWRGSNFRNDILKAVNEDNVLGEYINDKTKFKIIIENSFNNKNATITAKIEIEKDLIVGVQMEGKQYRRFIVIKENTQKNMYYKFKEKNIWFKDGYHSQRGKDILQYKLGEDKVFYYEWEDIGNIQIEVLKNKVLEDLKEIIGKVDLFESIIVDQ